MNEPTTREPTTLDINGVMKYLPHRYPFLLVDRVLEFVPGKSIRALKNVTYNEPYFTGHFPHRPLMPGVIMCEAAAQLSSYYAVKNKLMDGMMGFGGMEDIRFRGVVRPGDRFVIVTRLLKARRTIITCEFQSFVGQNLVCEGLIKGIPLPLNQLTAGQPGGPMSGDET